jgi:hypothetical protein
LFLDEFNFTQLREFLTNVYSKKVGLSEISGNQISHGNLFLIRLKKFYKEFTEKDSLDFNETQILPISQYQKFLNDFRLLVTEHLNYSESMDNLEKHFNIASQIFIEKNKYKQKRRFFLLLKHFELNQCGVSLGDILRIFKILKLFQIVNDIGPFEHPPKSNEYILNRNKLASFIHKYREESQNIFDKYSVTNQYANSQITSNLLNT